MYLEVPFFKRVEWKKIVVETSTLLVCKVLLKKHKPRRESPFFIELWSGTIQGGNENLPQSNPHTEQSKQSGLGWWSVCWYLRAHPGLLFPAPVSAPGTQGKSQAFASVCTGSSPPSSVCFAVQRCKIRGMTSDDLLEAEVYLLQKGAGGMTSFLAMPAFHLCCPLSLQRNGGSCWLNVLFKTLF